MERIVIKTTHGTMNIQSEDGKRTTEAIICSFWLHAAFAFNYSQKSRLKFITQNEKSSSRKTTCFQKNERRKKVFRLIIQGLCRVSTAISCNDPWPFTSPDQLLRPMKKKAVHTTGREYTIRSWVSDISFSFCEHFSAKCNQMNPTKSRLKLDHFSPLKIYKSNANFYSISERKRGKKYC